MNYNEKELIVWSETFSCGIKIIDEQHKELVNMINEMFLHVSGSAENERDFLIGIIYKTIDYIKVHFATEEKIMRVIKYSGYSQHKKAHDRFVISIVDTINELNIGKHLSLYTFTKFLKEWVFSHIAVMDRGYFKYCREIATRKDNGRLSISEKDVKDAVSA